MRRYEYDDDIEERHFSWTDLFIKVIIVLIFILFTIWLISLPNRKRVSSTNNVGSASAFSQNINNMRDVGQSYFTTERLPEKEGDIKTISLEKMYKNKMLLTLTDKNGRACSAKNSYVSIQKVGNEYQMKTYLECGNDSDYIITTMGCYDYCKSDTKTDICEKKYSDADSKDNKREVTDKNGGKNSTKPMNYSAVEYQYAKKNGGKWGAWSNFSEWLTTKIAKTDYTDVEKKVVNEHGSVEYQYTGVATCPTVRDYKLSSNTNGKCTYVSTQSNTADPTCPSVSGYSLSGRSGLTCNYKKTSTSTANPTCPSVSGYSLSGRSGLTCNYTKTTTSSEYTLSYYGTGSGSYIPKDTSTYHYVQKSADYVYKCDGSCGMRWYYTYTIYKKTYKTVTSTTTKPAICPDGYKGSGSTCVNSTTSTTTKPAICPDGHKGSGNTCVKTVTNNLTVKAICPTGQTNASGKCYKTINTPAKSTTYYRYRTRIYINENTDYKWSSSNNDNSLLKAGYILTGNTRNVKGEK